MNVAARRPAWGGVLSHARVERSRCRACKRCSPGSGMTEPARQRKSHATGSSRPARRFGSQPPDDTRRAAAGELLAALTRMARLTRPGDARGRLPAPQLSALGALLTDGPLTLGELAASEGVKPPSMTKTVQALERAGMVRRGRDPRDGRVVILQATGRGRRAFEAGRGDRTGLLLKMLGELSDREVATLRRAAALLRAMPNNPPESDQ